MLFWVALNICENARADMCSSRYRCRHWQWSCPLFWLCAVFVWILPVRKFPQAQVEAVWLWKLQLNYWTHLCVLVYQPRECLHFYDVLDVCFIYFWIKWHSITQTRHIVCKSPMLTSNLSSIKTKKEKQSTLTNLSLFYHCAQYCTTFLLLSRRFW